MVGSLLGGGLGPFTGLHGYSCDQLISARIITSTGDIISVSKDSKADEEELVNLIRGAGVGLGIITSVTLRMYKISTLELEEGDKVVHYTAMFSEPSFGFAADLYASLTPVADPRLGLGCMLTTAPPAMPGGGSPVMMIAGHFIGSKAAAEKAFGCLVDKKTTDQAIFARLSTTELASMSAQSDARFSAPAPGYNDIFNGLVQNISAETILAASRRWLAFRNAEGPQAARKLTVMIAGTCTQGMLEADPDAETGFTYRDRGFMGQILLMGLSDEEIGPTKDTAQAIVDTLRKDDDAKGLDPAVYANNARAKTPFAEVYGVGKLEKYRQVKGLWDPKGVFWSPTTEQS